MEIDVFLALTSAGVPEVNARAAVTAIRKELSDGIREGQDKLATKVDVAQLKVEMANMKADVFQRLSEMQRYTVASMFGGFGVMAALVTLLKFLG